ncbi:hypothetical protein JCM3765_001837 [Sporobolomyces pararoseus]
MSTELSEDTQIDRLSSLPPELLSPIFDLAHDPEEPLREPLSKTLLPYFRQNLYRQIRISSSSSLSKLLATVQSNPSLAQLINDLDTSEDEAEPDASYPLKRLLPHLPSLQSLSITELPSLSHGIDSSIAHSLKSFRALSYRCTTLSNIDLGILSHLQNLRQLEIRFAEYVSEEEEESECARLDGVETLELGDIWQGQSGTDNAWMSSVSNFIDRFPRLTKLTLVADNTPCFARVLSSLTEVKQSLKSLELWSPEQEDEFGIACDHLLPRFPNLEHLYLGDGTVSSNLPLHLAQLAHLQTLTLGCDTQWGGPSARQLLSLVQGPTRILTLRSLFLDSFSSKVGKRFDVEDAIDSRRPLTLSDWRDHHLHRAEDWEAADIWRLKEAGVANGVKVSGSTFEALRVSELAVLERANRLILHTYQTKSFKEYIAKRASPLVRPRLPDLDVSQLDPQNLKLVKIDLPKEDWYQFTLE